MLLAAGPLIDLKPFVHMVVVHHSNWPELCTSKGTTKRGNIHLRPLAFLQVSSPHKSNHLAEFHDGGQNKQWPLKIMTVHKTSQANFTSIRFDVHPDMLTNYYKD